MKVKKIVALYHDFKKQIIQTFENDEKRLLGRLFCYIEYCGLQK